MLNVVTAKSHFFHTVLTNVVAAMATNFCRTMLCKHSLCCHAVSVCLSNCYVCEFCQNE